MKLSLERKSVCELDDDTYRCSDPNEFPNKKNSYAPNRVTRFAKSATKPTVVGNESSDLDGYGEGDEALLVVLLFLAESIGFSPPSIAARRIHSCLECDSWQ